MFSIRVVSLDHYMSKSINELYTKEEQNSIKEWQEPVLRIFGVTPDGFKSCVHVHGVYPYILVPYKGGENAERDALLLGAALDEALRTSLNSKVLRYIYKVTPVSGIPLYGYHSKHRQFFKIYFYNPFHIRKAMELLLSGAILGQKLQAHEAHIPYALQFMIDYNIYGMSFVTFSKVKYRKDPENPDSLVGVRKEDILSSKVKKVTWSRLEVDALESDILNAIGGKSRGVNPGIEALWEDEKRLRRFQNRDSQMTLQQSQSRSEVQAAPTEIMYKARLAEKLAEASSQDSEGGVTGEGLRLSYPAEVPESGIWPNASATDEDLECLPDVRELIDETILTQISGSREKEEEGEGEGEEEEEMEADSVLGRNQRSEEEAELEEEEGVDMTQPLEPEEEVICGVEGSGDEPGSSSGIGEESFWKNMAEKIFQLDGAQESSSSESEGDATRATAPAHPGSDGPLELSSALPCSIMSILNECGGWATPPAASQTPRTFWFDHSPDWLPQNEDSWIWNKCAATSLDFPGKSHGGDSNSSGSREASKDVATGKTPEEFFSPRDDECFPTSPDAFFSHLEPTVSPPSAILTPASEVDASDVNLDSKCEDFSSPSKEKKSFPLHTSTESEVWAEGKPEFDRERLLNVLKSFAGRKVPPEDDGGQLTLKEYIKDCKEIVSVEFKNLCNREMVVIEYKTQNKKSVRSKYLIKPLEKFLESWNSAERRASERSSAKFKKGVKVVKEIGVGSGKNVRSNYVINVVGQRFADASSIQSVSNKLTVKSMEILPEGGKAADRFYNVNENLISRGKIKMKLIKSERENLEKNVVEGALKRRRSAKLRMLDLKRAKTGKEKEGKQVDESRGNSQSKERLDKRRSWKNLSEPDAKLISEINSSFEEYFRSVVKRKNYCRKRQKNLIERINYDQEEEEEEEEEGEEEKEEEMEEETSEDEGPGRRPGNREPSQVVEGSRDRDAIKFVRRFLSAFSLMPDVPPLSITIRLGSSAASTPVQVSLRPSEKELKPLGKKHGKKTKIENVDGAADGSSSEESTEGDAERRPRGKKTRKKETRYEPLNVVVCGSPAGKREVGKRRRTFGRVREEATERAEDEGKLERASSVRPFRDGVDVCREEAKRGFLRGEPEKESSNPGLVKGQKMPPRRSRSSAEVLPDPGEESDFIGDSDEEREGRRKRRSVKAGKRSSRTEGEREGIREKITEKDSLEVLRSEEEREGPSSEAARAEGFGDSQKGGGQRFAASSSSFTSDFVRSTRVHLVSSKAPEESFGDAETPAPCSGEEAVSAGALRSSDSSGPERFGCSSGEKAFSEESGVASLDRVSGSKRIRPKERPLSLKEVVESLPRLAIADGEEKAAFYGNPADVEVAAESEFKGRRIESRSTARLKPFKSSLRLRGTEERRNPTAGGRKTERWRLVGGGDLSITPLRKPPSREAACKFESGSGNPEEKREKGRIKIVRPLSPGQEMESEEELELSVTMCSFSGGGESRGSGGADSLESPWRPGEPERGLKKGPLAKIKGIKKKCSLAKLVELPEGRTKDASPGRSAPEREGCKEDNSFQIRGVTPNDTFGFSHSLEDVKQSKLDDAHQYMSLLSMELHVQTRKGVRPDPEYDPIRALFYSVTFDDAEKKRETGAVVVGEGFLSGSAAPELSVVYVASEKALFDKFLVMVRAWDPEILAGYEVEMHSWGYLVQRGFVLELNLLLLLGRVRTEDFPRKSTSDHFDSKDDVDGIPKNVRHMRISGRIVLDVWRVLRHEMALTSYTFENVMYNLLHERHPTISHERLSYYWEHPGRRLRHLVVEHYATRVLCLVAILDRLDFVNRTSELARLFGIQFYEVLSRGSQFRVESMMLRSARPLDYVAVSPTVSQRAAMRAPASLPLILEPESLFYTDPVIVLDFQSLYPSIIIAYNYCFSTCLGRVDKLGGREPFEFGCTQLQISPEELRRLEDDLSISPAGVAFVKSNVRKGVLPAMLEKILETRLMVKKSMKENKENRALQKVLFARQLGLKLIANVTYGYTAANFSGRMPCIEVGDSVVSKGRETLQRAIQLVKSRKEWGARVVYGDTDSIFVLTPGRTREEAFKIGEEIADAVTQDNPKPVKLKLEKVYQPCILQTKKRYLGYMFESPEQKTPVFEAKGVETVRRDGCPATGKILEKAIRILFDTGDVSLVKKYVVRQFAKLYQGSVNLQDLIFAKEYRGRNGYRPGACVPALHLAKQWTRVDRRAEPRVKERVPYVIVNGPPGVPLIRLVRSPADFLSDPSLRINALYYVTKAIVPPLQRCFSLLGVNVASWYAEMPKKHRKTWAPVEGRKRSTISQYFAALECVICSEVTAAPVCEECEREPQTVAVVLEEKIRRGERCHEGLMEICRSCCGRPAELHCASLDCPVLFRRNQALGGVERGRALREILARYL